MTARQMSKVIVYENGNVEVHDIGESYHSVQSFGQYGNENGKGKGQYCLRDDVDVYIPILAQKFLEEIDSEIESLQAKRKRLEKNLSKLIKE